MRVSIEPTDSTPDLVSVNHVNHGDIPYGQTGRTKTIVLALSAGFHLA
jgi:hypothetical protein